MAKSKRKRSAIKLVAIAPCTFEAATTKERLVHANGHYERINTDVDGFEAYDTIRILDILDRLLKTGEIDDEHYQAGKILYRDWSRAGLSHVGVIDPSRESVDYSPRYDIADFQLEALTRFSKAVKSLSQEHARIISQVILQDISLVEYARTYHNIYSHTAARPLALYILKQALTALEEYYFGKRKN